MQLGRHALFWIAVLIVSALLLRLLAPVLLPFVVGLALAYFVNPLVDFLGRMKIPRWLSALLILIGATCIVGMALIFLLPVLAEQARSLIEAAPAEFERLRGIVETYARERFGNRSPAVETAVKNMLDSISGALPDLTASVAGKLWNQGFAAFNFLALMLVTPLVFFYALLDWPKLVARIDSWLPRDHAQQLRGLASEIDERVSAFVRGQGTVCLILAVFYATALSAIGLRYGLLVGLLTGLASFIPFAGWALGLIAASILGIVQYWPDVMSILLVPSVFLAGQALDAGFLGPKIVGSKVGLHPVWLIFALLTFSYLFGFLGLLVAVPVSAAIGVLVRFGLRTYLASSVYNGQGASKG